VHVLRHLLLRLNNAGSIKLGGKMARGSATAVIGRCLVLAIGLLTAGCNRTFYREHADVEVSALVGEKSNDPRWALPGFDIEVDARSRYADVYDRDFPPMPPDDPASHQLMHCIDGKDGYSGWHDSGSVQDLESPYWRDSLAQYCEFTPDGRVILGLDDAVRIARINSPDYQQTLETIYLSALDVSTERFRFDTQFFGGTGIRPNHTGPNRGNSNRLSIDTAASARRQFSAAGELLVGFANNTVWEFTGPNRGLSTSLLNFTFVQPLLRAGGRAVALERLTITERALLSNLRAFQRYRDSFYVDITIGGGTINGVSRRGGFFGAGLTGFTGQGTGFAGVGGNRGFGGGAADGGGGGGGAFAGGGVGNQGGFIGLLQTMQQIRNAQESYNAQVRTLALLEANLEAGLINLSQVDQFRQSIETQQANLLQSRNGFQGSLETFKRSTLGLPPDLAIELDDSFIDQFRLIGEAQSNAQNNVDTIIADFAELPETPSTEQLTALLDRTAQARLEIEQRLDATPVEFEAMDAVMPKRFETMTPAEQQQFAQDRTRLFENFAVLKERYDATAGVLAALRAGLTGDPQATTGGLISLLTEMQSIVSDVGLLQSRTRIERLTVDPIELSPEVALEIARANRLDWMNNRAALVDVWRLIEFNANALKSDLTIEFSGDLQAQATDATGFLGRVSDGGTLRASVQIDPPFTRLVERNVFRQQLIQYQQSRRQMIQFEDATKQSLRQLLRDLEFLRVNLEIQRRAVAIAIRRVDQTREDLNAPVPPALPGQLPQTLGPTVAQNLLFALADLRSAQDALMSVWLGYYGTRMRLYRDLGVMQLDDEGLWIDVPFLADAPRTTADEDPLPPPIPAEWMNDAAFADPDDAEVSTISAETDDASRESRVRPSDWMSALWPSRKPRQEPQPRQRPPAPAKFRLSADDLERVPGEGAETAARLGGSLRPR